MKTFYVTFGQNHTHTRDGLIYNKDTVGVLRADDYAVAVSFANELFGKQYSRITEDLPDMQWFPAGLLLID